MHVFGPDRDNTIALVCVYVGMYVVITTLLVLPGGLGQAFHHSLYWANNFAPYYTTYTGTGTNQKGKDPLGSFHGNIHLNATLWCSHAWLEHSYLPP